MIGGYICDSLNCNDSKPDSPAETAVTVALFLLLSSFSLVVFVLAIIVFHFVMWQLEILHNVDTSRETPCR